MSDIEKALEQDLEATTLGLQQQVASLQRNLTKLQQMVTGTVEEWDAYQFKVWTEGSAAQNVTQIANLLSRQETLQKAIRLLKGTQEP